MHARRPEEIHTLLADAMNAGDLDAFVELHEPGARTLVPTDGRQAGGRAEIRRALEPVFALGPRLENEVVDRIEGDGIALTHARWTLTANDGERVFELAGCAAIVSRQQRDGTWRVALENTLSPR